MAAFIKRILKKTQIKRQPGWASREEMEKFERQRQQWKDDMSTFMIR